MRVVLVGAIVVAGLATGVSAAAAQPPVESSYQRVCETTGISPTRGGEATYTVNAGRNVNVRFVEDGFARINYPTRGWMPAGALCSSR